MRKEKTFEELVEERICIRPSITDNGCEFGYDKNGNTIYAKDKDTTVWKEYDDNYNCIHYKCSNGNEYWKNFDRNGIRCIHSKYSTGDEFWYDLNGNKISEDEYNKIYLIGDYTTFAAVKLNNIKYISDITEALAMNGNTFDTNGENIIFIHTDEIHYLLSILNNKKIEYELQ